MPLPNRIRPDGSLFADPARGLLFGNRGGKFHDPATQTLPTRLFATKQWICCVLSFKGRQRNVWGRYYTELFFCDEVTALAAGHRPCVECRRADAHAYRAALVAGLGLAEVPLFPVIDERLDRERRNGREKRLHKLPAESLPDGAMIATPEGEFLALRGAEALLWSPSGYVASRKRPADSVTVVTPPSSLAALVNGYQPLWHPSAAELA
ncbi:hypothetical protein LJR090_003602 [Bosea sp. LjRoot90]|uniref:hypothetical protein n=1 Tax=Bosea sp. LjRoot90 TaxID=3342342 RepID=UPI003ED15151